MIPATKPLIQVLTTGYACLQKKGIDDRPNVSRLTGSQPVQTVSNDQFEKINGEFDLIVTNLPYVTRAEIATQAPQVDHALGVATGNKGASLGHTACEVGPI